MTNFSIFSRKRCVGGASETRLQLTLAYMSVLFVTQLILVCVCFTLICILFCTCITSTVGTYPKQEEPLSISFNKVSLHPVPDTEIIRKSLYKKVQLILHTCNDNGYRAVLERMTPLEGQQGVLKYKDVKINFRIGSFADYIVALVYTEQCKAAKNPLIVALDTFPKAQAIIGVGTGYGVDPKSIKLGDVMVPKYVYDASMLVITENDVKAREGEGHCKVEQSILLHFNDVDVRDEWKFNITDARSSQVKTGTLVSSSILIEYRSFRDKLLAHINKPIGGEMEGSLLLEILHEVKRRNPKPSVITIKGVANYGDDEETNGWQPIAAKAAVDYVHYCLRKTERKGRFYAIS